MGLRQRLVLLLQLFEQTHVLDRYDGLISEGLEQLDLRIRKRSGLRPIDENRPNRHPFVEHRNPENASPPADERPFVLVLLVSEKIGNLDDGSTQNGPT